MFDEFAPGLPWCRCARNPSGGPRGPAKTAQERPVVRPVCSGFAAVPGRLKLSQGPKRDPRQLQDAPKPKTASKAPGALDGSRAPPRRPQKTQRWLKQAPWGSREGPKGHVVRQVCRWFAAALGRGKFSQETPQYSPKRRPRRPPDPKSAPRQSSSSPPPEDVQDSFQAPQAAQERCLTAQTRPKTAQEGPRWQPIRPSEGPLFDEFAPGLPWCWGAWSPSGGPRRGPAKKAQERPLFDQFAAGAPRCWGA